MATGAMGKPQILKRVPIVKHENQSPPFFFLLLSSFSFLLLTLTLVGGGGAYHFHSPSGELARKRVWSTVSRGGGWFDDDI